MKLKPNWASPLTTIYWLWIEFAYLFPWYAYWLLKIKPFQRWLQNHS